MGYRLAARLGHVNVRKMLRQISHRDLIEWEVFQGLEASADEQAAWQFASLRQLLDDKLNDLMAIVVAVATSKKPKDVKRRKLEEYVLRFGDDRPEAPKRKQTAQEQWDILVKALTLHAAQSKAAETVQQRRQKAGKGQAAATRPTRSLHDRRGTR